MIIHTFHPRSSLRFTSLRFTSLHFTSLHFTSLHFPFLTSLHFWTFRHHAPTELLPFSLLTITYSTFFLKICDLQLPVASASADSWLVPQFDCPIYNEVFTDVCMRIVRTSISFSTADIRFVTSSSSSVKTHYTILCYSYHAFS
jgi:hypothetical protein